jgi:hypothetical protein
MTYNECIIYLICVYFWKLRAIISLNNIRSMSSIKTSLTSQLSQVVGVGFNLLFSLNDCKIKLFRFIISCLFSADSLLNPEINKLLSVNSTYSMLIVNVEIQWEQFISMHFFISFNIFVSTKSRFFMSLIVILLDIIFLVLLKFSWCTRKVFLFCFENKQYNNNIIWLWRLFVLLYLLYPTVTLAQTWTRQTKIPRYKC